MQPFAVLWCEVAEMKLVAVTVEVMAEEAMAAGATAEAATEAEAMVHGGGDGGARGARLPSRSPAHRCRAQ